MVNIRKSELDNLKRRQLDVCMSLGQEPIAMSECPLPTMDEIANFANYIKRLEDEKFKRESKFIEVKYKILDIVQELEITPSLEIEKKVCFCSPDDSLFHVTDFNMKWIDEYYKSLVQQKNQTIYEITNLREKLGGLWGMLSEDVKTSNEFLETYKGNSLTTLHALQTEVKRCDNLKKANIEKCILKMRADLISLWEKCHFTAYDRESCEYFQDNLYTEDLLTFHGIEIDKVKKYYDDNKDALKLLEAREQYWKKRLELEEKERDPNRYKNRGATLLKEQKELTKIVKKINQMEQELLVMAEKYEEKHEKPFLSWGRTIVDIIEKTYEDYETDKKKQLSAKKQQRSLPVTPTKSTLFLGSTLSSSRKNLHTLTPSAGMTPQKRKLPPTSLFSSGKKKTPSKAVCDVVRTNTKNSTTTDKNGDSKKRLEKIRRLSEMLEKNATSNEDSDDYDNFEKEIAVKASCRSTLLNAACSNADLAEPLTQTPKKGSCNSPT